MIQFVSLIQMKFLKTNLWRHTLPPSFLHSHHIINNDFKNLLYKKNVWKKQLWWRLEWKIHWPEYYVCDITRFYVPPARKIVFMCLSRGNSFFRYSWKYSNVVYSVTEKYNVEIELRMCIIVLQRNAIYFLFFFFSLLLRTASALSTTQDR